jgi:hypothetical protein
VRKRKTSPYRRRTNWNITLRNRNSEGIPLQSKRTSRSLAVSIGLQLNHPKRSQMKKRVLLSLLCVIFVSCSPAPPPKTHCQEWVHLDWFDLNDPNKLPHSEVGPLHCNGTCKDKSPCKPQTQNINIPGGGDGLIKKEWCGCPEDPNEPNLCHGVRETYRSGNKQIVKFNCHGDCPAAEPGEVCREVHRQTDAPKGVDKRFVVQCECLGPPPQPAESPTPE